MRKKCLRSIVSRIEVFLKNCFIIYAIILLCFGCSDKEQLRPYDLSLPSNLPIVVIDDIKNPLTQEGVQLGRKLFFDPILSVTNTIACASCHQPTLAFSDGLSLSKGVRREMLDRHTPALMNLLWQKSYFWDGGGKNLESQAFAPISHPKEMGMDLKSLTVKLQAIPYYQLQFQKVFQSDTIFSAYIVRALAQFQKTLISANSKYDYFIRKEEGVTFNEKELKGLQIFRHKCQQCHTEGLFTDNNFHNIGLDSNFPPDLGGIYQGRFRITRDSADIGKFKTPTLRNIMKTAPYMHDGRFSNINEVFQHYTKGVQLTESLEAIFIASENTLGIALSEQEQEDLTAFLYTLSEDYYKN